MQDYILFFWDGESSKVPLSDVEAHKTFPNAAFFSCSHKCHIGSDKKSRCSTLVIVSCKSYIYFGREKIVHTKKKKRGENKGET
jgi:hypothetical protein